MAGSGLLLFWRQFWQHYHTTGAVWPSGPELASELARELAAAPRAAAGNDSSAPRQILEVGPGTGTITAAIIAKLRPSDRLTLVEINPDFAAHLKRRMANETAWRAAAERIEIVTERLENFSTQRRFHRIISGLPLNNFDVANVAQILRAFEELSLPGGAVSFFEYIAVRRVKAAISGKSERDRLNGVGAEIERFLAGREVRRRAVWSNIPPAWAHHVVCQLA